MASARRPARIWMPAQIDKSFRVARIDDQRLAILLLRLAGSPQPLEGDAHIIIAVAVLRIEPDDLLELLESFVVSLLVQKTSAEILMRDPGIGLRRSTALQNVSSLANQLAKAKLSQVSSAAVTARNHRHSLRPFGFLTARSPTAATSNPITR